MTPTLVTTVEQLRALPDIDAPTAVVMTMGALHDGHGHLMTVARERVGDRGRVIVTDFVNPTQFGAGEDFDRYPRTLEADLAVCAHRGVDVVFAPSVEVIYPDGDLAAGGITIQPGPLGDILEGASRPGHFAGVLTVVAKLLHLTAADIALFGEKDYQQLVLIRAMVRALAWPVLIEGVPTVREADGLAMSSRNRYLSAEDRERAVVIPAAIKAGVAASAEGSGAVRAATLDVLRDNGLQAVYVEVTDPELGPAPAAGPARLLVAVPVGGTRLLDNAGVHLGGTA
jgi:pantoate--beta-alanine ligase